MVQNNLDPTKSFYLSEVAVDMPFWNKGIASRLLEKQLEQRTADTSLCFRTLNPAMLRVVQKVAGPVYFAIPEETSYKNGVVYVVKR